MFQFSGIMSSGGVNLNRTLTKGSNSDAPQIAALKLPDIRRNVELSIKSVSPQIYISSTTPQCPYPWFEDTKPTVKPSNFSIEHILHSAGDRLKTVSPPRPVERSTLFDWLQCTRYRPPKLQRKFLAVILFQQ